MVTVVVVTELAVSRLVVAKNSFLFLLVTKQISSPDLTYLEITGVEKNPGSFLPSSIIPPPKKISSLSSDAARFKTRTATENPFLGIGRPKKCPDFHILVSVSDLYILRISPHTYFLQAE